MRGGRKGPLDFYTNLGYTSYMKQTTIFKTDSKGKSRQWTISVEGNPQSETEPATIKIESGLIDGKKVTESIEITSGKNLTKLNSTTPYTQAVAQAKAKLELKLRGEYVKELSQVSQGVLRSGIPQCMLAHKFHPTGEQKSSKTLKQMKIEGEEILISRKLDGNRCLIRITPDCVVSMWTRKGDLMPVQLSHIQKEIVNGYNQLYEGVETEYREEMILDGELYVNPLEMSFNTLNGHLKRKNNQDVEQLSKIKYHIYDFISPKPYTKRYEVIKNFATDNVHLVESYKITATDENINTYLEKFLAEGFEGAMLRIPDKGYENKRSWSLVKVKIFEDQEYKILDLVPSSMGKLGHFLMEMDKAGIDVNGKEVTTFKAGLGKGVTHEEGMKMLVNKEAYIGKMATIEYFGKDIRPRFPKFKSLRENI